MRQLTRVCLFGADGYFNLLVRIQKTYGGLDVEKGRLSGLDLSDLEDTLKGAGRLEGLWMVRVAWRRC